MKNDTEMKYPNAANLFQFCRKILDHKYGGVRVIDQDVGQILGFDPADCSHWKKGKKNIRSIQAIKSIASNLGVDERLVVDVAAGEISVPEAYFEYSGYGSMEVDAKVIENARKEYFKKNTKTWDKELENNFKKYFVADEEAIVKIVDSIHEKISFEEAPLYIPELVSYYPEISLAGTEVTESEVTLVREGSKFNISYKQGSEMRPFVRFQMAKILSTYFLDQKLIDTPDMQSFRQHIQDVEGNIFASHLLAPKRLIAKEVKELSMQRDIVSQLAEVFWVSKAFMNRRLQEILSLP